MFFFYKYKVKLNHAPVKFVVTCNALNAIKLLLKLETLDTILLEILGYYYGTL